MLQEIDQIKQFLFAKFGTSDKVPDGDYEIPIGSYKQEPYLVTIKEGRIYIKGKCKDK